MGAKRIDTAGAGKSAWRVASTGHRSPPARTVMRCLLKQVLELEPVHGGGEKMALAYRAAERLLAGMTFVRHGERIRSIRGEVVHAEFANLDQTTFCPACLLEDGKPDSHSGGIRLARVAWQIEAVRTCPLHGLALPILSGPAKRR